MIEPQREPKTEFIKRAVDDQDYIDLIPDRNERLIYLSKVYDGLDIIKIKQGPAGNRGLKGEKGKDGKDGYTPVKGKDYVDGKDGFVGRDGKDGKNGRDGKDGKDGIDGVTEIIYNEDAEAVARDLEDLPEKDKLDPRKALKDFDKLFKAGKKAYLGGGGGGMHIESPATADGWVDDADAPIITVDLSAGQKHRVTIEGDRTFAVINATIGRAFLIRILQDNTGNHTPTWFNGISWAGGSEPAITATADKATLYGFLPTAVNEYDGFLVGSNI